MDSATRTVIDELDGRYVDTSEKNFNRQRPASRSERQSLSPAGMTVTSGS